jgi:hypothetical protein
MKYLFFIVSMSFFACVSSPKGNATNTQSCPEYFFASVVKDNVFSAGNAKQKVTGVLKNDSLLLRVTFCDKQAAKTIFGLDSLAYIDTSGYQTYKLYLLQQGGVEAKIWLHGSGRVICSVKKE